MAARRAFLRVLGAAALALSAHGVIGQQPKVPRVGMLYFTRPTDAFYQTHVNLFRRRLAELGYVDGKTIIIEERFADGSEARLNELAREMVAGKMDVIVTQAVAATVAAHKATTTIPIVMLHAGNPIEAGLIESLARPGGNVTGTSNISLGGKLMDLLREIVPGLRKVALLANPTNAGVPPARKDIAEAARRSGISVVFVPVTRADEFPAAFDTIRAARPHGLLVLMEPVIGSHRAKIIEFAASNRLPALYDNGSVARDGGLISYAPVFIEHYALAAVYVDKILKGAKPGDLPVQQPRTFELVINRKAAAAIGVTIPQAVLLRADEVI